MSDAIWITRWNEVAAHWSEAMWRSCWQGGVCAVLIWMSCRYWRRIPAAMRYGLWWMVCLKLAVGLCPIFPALPFLPPAPNALPVAVTPQVVSVRMTSPVTETTVYAPLYASPNSTGRARASLSVAAWLMGAWLIATGTLVWLCAGSLRRLLRLIRQAEPLADPALQSVAQEAATAIGVRSVPRILVTPADVGVLTLGAWRPIVLLSQQTLACCTPAELRLVLAHEFAHIRRGDAWLGLLPQLTQILFCFYPLAWLACREVDLAREVACDEQTLCALQARPDSYGRLLLKLGARRDSWLSLCTPGVSSHFRVLHRRLSMLQQITERSPRRLRGRAILLMCLIGAAVGAPWSLVHAQNPAPNASGGGAQTQVSSRDNTATGSPQPVADGNTQNGDAKPVIVHARQQTGAAIVSAAKDKTKPAPARTKQTAPVLVKFATADHTGRQTVASLVRYAGTKPASAGENADWAETLLARGPSEPQAKLETKLFRLHYAMAESVAKTLGALFEAPAPNTTKILADARTNTVIIQANAARLDEISNVLKGLDVANASEGTYVDVIALKYAQANDLAHTLTTLFADKGETIKIAADERTNVIIIQSNRDKCQEIGNLIQQLDVDHK